MDDQQVRQAVCRAARELWLAGLVAGDGGLVAIELNRRRYVVAPPGARKADLQPHQTRDVDLGGEVVGDSRDGKTHALPPAYWRPCAIAFRAGARRDDDRRAPGPAVHACVVAQPVALMALMHKDRLTDGAELTLASGRTLPALDPATPEGEDRLRDAVGETPGILVPTLGLFVPAATLDRALNRVERLAHDAAVTLAAR